MWFNQLETHQWKKIYVKQFNSFNMVYSHGALQGPDTDSTQLNYEGTNGASVEQKHCYFAESHVF